MLSDISVDDFSPPPPSLQRSKTERLKCCSGCTTDKRLLTLIIQFVLSLLLILFSGFMLINSSPCESGPYQNLVFCIVSFWLGRKSSGESS